MTIRVGTRKSPLALLQTEGAVQALGLAYTLCPIDTPGDRDLKTDLRSSPGDFFTQGLDEALRNHQIDCAIHSAKDLPPDQAEDIDWFWLPGGEDPTDAWVFAPGVTRDTLPVNPRIGVSSERRTSYALRILPNGVQAPIRGTIQQRLDQLDAGHYDCLIMAVAALNRLGLRNRISEVIPLDELPPPEGQGRLAMTFRKGDPSFTQLRARHTKAVRFISAGVGDGELCTLAGARELSQADVCLYDTLLGADLLAYLPPHCQAIPVGKRSGAHYMKQAQITQLLCDKARCGYRVVRLKGGDAGLFGRLAEEVSALDALGIAYHVWPGVSALTAATTATGILLTRREASKGFTVETLRSAGEATPTVYFMSIATCAALAIRYPAVTPVAIVYNAGRYDTQVEHHTVGDLATYTATTDAPGLIIVGDLARYSYPQKMGPLQGRRIWTTASDAITEKARTAILDLGGKPCVQPLIKLVPRPTAETILSQMATFDDLVVTSPAAARILLASRAYDRRDLPRIAVCGPGTAQVFAEAGITIDIMPESDYSAKGLQACLPDLTGRNVLRVRSAKASWQIGTDCILYDNEQLTIEPLPQVDAIFFASASAVHSLYAQHGLGAFECDLIVLGQPTAQALRQYGLEPTVISPTATIPAAIAAYADTLP